MRLILLSVACQIITLGVYGQLDDEARAFVYAILKREPASDSIRYTDKLKPGGTFSLTDKNFRNSTIIGYDPLRKRNVKVALSKAESIQLQNQLRDFYKVRWRDSLFANSRMIPADSMWSFISKQIRLAFKENPAESHADLHWMYYSTVFQFSKPIFLRNRSIVIFYFLRICSANCGVEDFSVYRLQNGEYKRWLILAGGDF